MFEIHGGKPRRAKRSLALPVIVAGGVSSLLLAFSLTPTFSALTAAITNNTNTAGTGTLVMQETGPNSAGTATTCNSNDGSISSNQLATCTINKYGANLGMKPGQTVSTTIYIKSTGTINANTFSVKGDTCVQSTNGTVSGTATDLCDQYTVKVYAAATATGTPVYTGTAKAFGTAAATDLSGYIPLITNSTGQAFTISVSLADVGNSYQGFKITQPMTFTFGA
jgi:hypothetical protein